MPRATPSGPIVVGVPNDIDVPETVPTIPVKLSGELVRYVITTLLFWELKHIPMLTIDPV